MPRLLSRLPAALLSAFMLLAGEGICSAAGKVPDAGELKKAERILVKLSELQTASTNPTSYRAIVRRFYPQLFASVANLRQGDLKTDLSTAVFLYEKADHLERGEEATDCRDEVRDFYRKLCLAHGGPTRLQLLLAKAQLHSAWAKALLRFYRGEGDSLTAAVVAEIRNERVIDLALAERVVAVLKTLDAEVNSYSSLGEFEEQGTIAKVSYEKLSKDFETAARTIRPLLSSLPRNLLSYQLQNALNSYGDGLFWWQKTHHRGTAAEAVVSAGDWTEPAPQRPLDFDAASLNYTVICNWRKARRHMISAALEIEGAKSNLTASNSTSGYISLR